MVVAITAILLGITLELERRMWRDRALRLAASYARMERNLFVVAAEEERKGVVAKEQSLREPGAHWAEAAARFAGQAERDRLKAAHYARLEQRYRRAADQPRRLPLRLPMSRSSVRSHG
jgi:hypothetical protein